MNTATCLLVIAVAVLAVGGAPIADAEPGSDDSGNERGGSCIMYDPDNKPPVMVDPDACIIDP